MDVEAGLHTRARRGPGARAPRPSGTASTLHDLRPSPADLDVPRGPARRAPGVRVVHTVGSDCAIGKMTVTLELDARRARARRCASVVRRHRPDRDRDRRLGHRRRPRDLGLHRRRRRAARRRGRRARRRCSSSRARARSSTRRTRASRSACCTAACRTCWCSATGPARRRSTTTPRSPIPPLRRARRASYEAVAVRLRPARVAAIALNTRDLDDDAARAAIADAAAETGLVTDDPVRFGAERMLDAVLAAV